MKNPRIAVQNQQNNLWLVLCEEGNDAIVFEVTALDEEQAITLAKQQVKDEYKGNPRGITV